MNSQQDPLEVKKSKPLNQNTPWNVVQAFHKRSLGLSANQNPFSSFNSKCYSSLRFVQRLELAYKMDRHNGCVNALHFHPNGTRLASGSDDLNIIIWEPMRPKGVPLITYDSGHRGNVFQAKFLPLCGNQLHVVSCARDGHVRLAELNESGCVSTRRLGLHRGPAHKLTIFSDTPHVFLSAGEDAAVLEIDVRQSKPNKLLTVKQDDRKVAIYSIQSHPIDDHHFCVGGRDSFVRSYDRRIIRSETQTPLRTFCPSHLVDSSVRAHVTCAVYNYNGTEILASYNDEDIYSFPAQPDNGDPLCDKFSHRFVGHRNNATVKGVNYYGPNSEFVVSGSDCGNIFFWDAHSEVIVNCLNGDENGVVNCLEPHPLLPILATSGLDDDVKVWMPKCSDEPQLQDLMNTVQTNQREREEERSRESESMDGEMLWILWRHIRRTERRRRQQQQRMPNQENRHNLSSSSDESGDSETENAPRVQCAPS